MRKRTKAREYALKMLYAIDVAKIDAEKCVEEFWLREEEKDAEIRDFANLLVKGVADNAVEVDRLISKYTTNWQLKRMAAIDRNILRFATYELIFRDDIPPKVSINEAIDVSKKYGDNESGKFVNGVLDKINKTEVKKTDKVEP
jgi:transcription antitermination factor NusB